MGFIKWVKCVTPRHLFSPHVFMPVMDWTERINLILKRILNYQSVDCRHMSYALLGCREIPIQKYRIGPSHDAITELTCQDMNRGHLRVSSGIWNQDIGIVFWVFMQTGFGVKSLLQGKVANQTICELARKVWLILNVIGQCRVVPWALLWASCGINKIESFECK